MTERLSQLQLAVAVIGPPSRFRLLTHLIRGERCVTDLATQVGLSQSCTTRHLQALSRAGLVRGVRAGKRVFFRLEPISADLEELLSGIARLVDGADVDGDVSLAPNRPSRPPPLPARAPAPSAPQPVLTAVNESTPVDESRSGKQGPSSRPPAWSSGDLDDFLL